MAIELLDVFTGESQPFIVFFSDGSQLMTSGDFSVAECAQTMQAFCEDGLTVKSIFNGRQMYHIQWED